TSRLTLNRYLRPRRTWVTSSLGRGCTGMGTAVRPRTGNHIGVEGRSRPHLICPDTCVPAARGAPSPQLTALKPKALRCNLTLGYTSHRELERSDSQIEGRRICRETHGQRCAQALREPVDRQRGLGHGPWP